jgi:hypothetical protein
MKLDSLRSLAALVCFATVAAGCVDRGTSDDVGDEGAGTSGDDSTAPGTADGDDDSRDSPSDPSAGDPPPGDPPRACTDACGAYGQCFPDEEYPLETCVQECTLALHEESLTCQTALVDLLGCYTRLECDAWFEDDACVVEQEALEEACDDGDDACIVGVGGDGDGSCFAMHSCPGEPEYAIECDETECRCYEDDEDVGGCAVQGVCMEGDVLEQAEACCGWSPF